MDTERGLKEKPRFASPVARGGQNEGKKKKQVQKEDRIKNSREEKEGGEGERESYMPSGQKEFETREVLEWSEKSKIGKGNGSTGVEPKRAKILDSEKENVSAREVKGGKLTKARRKRKMKEDFEEVEEVWKFEEGAGDAGESGAVQNDGEGVAEWREQDGDAEKFLEEKPVLSGGAENATSLAMGRKTKKKNFGVEVQDDNRCKKNNRDSVRAKGKGGAKEKKKGNSKDSKQKATQSATAGREKARVQGSIDGKEPRPISSLLSDSQYNDIFESVLDSSLEHCLEDAMAVLSEVEMLQASIGESCDSSAVGGNRDGEHKSGQSRKSSQKTVKGKKRKVLKNSVEAVREKSSGQRTEECEQEQENSNCSEDEYDLWVQCSIKSCKKWRKLECHEDLSVLPADWVCSQNTDPRYSSCICPEEDWDGSEEQLVLSSLVPGSMVWAQQPGFPWWPAMIENDPDSKSFFLFKNDKDKSPSKYHVTYFGEPVTRAWVSACWVKAFHTLPEEAALSTVKQQKDKMAFRKSLDMGRQAENLPLKRRLAQFGFLSHYNKGRDVSAEEDNTEQTEEYSCDEEDFDAKRKKICRKGAKPGAKKKAAKEPSEHKQNGRNGPKPNNNKVPGEKKEGMKGEKKKAMNTLFTGPKEKAPSKPEWSAGEANSCGKELDVGGGGAEERVLMASFTKPKHKKTKENQEWSAGDANSCGKELDVGGGGAEERVLTPSFTKPKHTKTKDKHAALRVAKPQLKVQEQTIQGITDCTGQEGGEGEQERGLGSATENKKAGKIKGKAKGVMRGVQKQGRGEERKCEMQQDLKSKGSVTKEDGRGSTSEGEMDGESKGAELEKEYAKKPGESVALEDLADFLEDDMEILNCLHEPFEDVGTDEEEDEEDFDVMQFKGVRATYVPV